MTKEVLKTTQLPPAVGPYSQVVRAGNLLFISGQISADPVTGEVIVQDVEKQTHTIMQLIRAALEEQGSSMAQIVKCTVHLSDSKHFSDMNRAYASYFDGDYPARLTVSGVQLYDGVDVEIDVIAAI